MDLCLMFLHQIKDQNKDSEETTKHHSTEKEGDAGCLVRLDGADAWTEQPPFLFCGITDIKSTLRCGSDRNKLALRNEKSCKSFVSIKSGARKVPLMKGSIPITP